MQHHPPVYRRRGFIGGGDRPGHYDFAHGHQCQCFRHPGSAGAAAGASLALGASKMQTIWGVTVPAAKSGILTGVVLGIGRALGEAMAINVVAGGSVNLPLPFNSVRFLTTQLVSEMGYAEGIHRQVLFTVGLVLYLFIMIVNLVLQRLRREGGKDDG